MSQLDSPSSLSLAERIKTQIVQEGRLDKRALRQAVGAAMSDRTFEMKFYECRLELQEEGIFINTVPGQPGLYVISSREHVIDKAMNKSRMKVVNAARKRQDLLRDAQKHSDMDDDSRHRLNAEEIAYSRTVSMIEQHMLKHQRKKLPGL